MNTPPTILYDDSAATPVLGSAAQSHGPRRLLTRAEVTKSRATSLLGLPLLQPRNEVSDVKAGVSTNERERWASSDLPVQGPEPAWQPPEPCREWWKFRRSAEVEQRLEVLADQ
ncbi:MAG: hypothetical protein KA110_08020 [Acidimicrobiia bacterium]|nr:hypothetical protein [Acidimicrobiia bacterium]